MPELKFDTERLLSQVAWVRALAHRLTRDPFEAEDLTQDTLLVALSRRPPEGALRPWLAGVVRNLLRSARRRGRHRAERESLSVREPEEPATDEIVARAAVHRALVGELLELEEPYRTTLLLRFFEELPIGAVAQRMGVPDSTARTRLQRGLALLRQRIERRGEGDARQWLAALLAPGFDTPGKAALTTSTVIAMSLPVKLTLVASALAGAFLLQRVLDRPAEPVARTTELPAPHTRPTSAVREVAALPPTRPEQPARASVPVAAARAAPEAAQEVLLLGRVLDVDGRPVPGVPLVARAPRPPGQAADDGPPVAVSAADGTFELAAPSGRSLLLAESAEHTTVLAASIPRDASSASAASRIELVVVVAWRAPFAGVVVDEAGDPVAGATVSQLEPSLRELGLALDLAVAQRATATTDAAGRFELTDAADLPRGGWTATAPGFERGFGRIPPGGDLHARLVLSTPARDPAKVRGIVLLPDGTPAEGAFVAYGMIAQRTGADGRFALWTDFQGVPIDDETPLTLRAVLPGYAPAMRTLPSLSVGRSEGWPDDVELELGPGEDQELAGLVVDEDGRPIDGVRLELVDATPFGQVAFDETGTIYAVRTLEELLAGPDAHAHTDADGRFRLAALPGRTYVVAAVERATQLDARSGPVTTEDEVRLVIDRRRLGTLSGRLRSIAGEPLAGVHVSVTNESLARKTRGEDAVTDEDGRFRIEGTAVRGIALNLTGEAIIHEYGRPLPADADPAALDLLVHRRAHVRFEWGRLEHGVTTLGALDRDGAPVDFHTISGEGWGRMRSVWVVGERSEVYALPEDAAWLVVNVDGEERERLPLALVPGEVNVIEL